MAHSALKEYTGEFAVFVRYLGYDYGDLLDADAGLRYRIVGGD
jgi:hypothetical protein